MSLSVDLKKKKNMSDIIKDYKMYLLIDIIIYE